MIKFILGIIADIFGILTLFCFGCGYIFLFIFYKLGNFSEN